MPPHLARLFITLVLAFFARSDYSAATVQFLWSGGITPTSARVNGKVDTDGAIVRLAVTDQSDLSNPIFSPPDTAITAENNRVVSLEIGGLIPNVQYYYYLEINGVADLSMTGRFRTFPAWPASFSFALGACSWTGSNASTFNTIRQLDPLFFFHLGDMNYDNIGVNDRNIYRQTFETVLSSPAQSQLYRNVPIAYMWDDHDYGPNNSDSTAPGRLAARLTYQEYVPYYPLEAGSGDVPIYHRFDIGRVRFLVCDSRSARSPWTAPDNAQKTMLGATQKAWFKEQLIRARDSAALVVWVNTLPWIGTTGDDGWYVYTNERRELADFIRDNQIYNLCQISGDAHMVAIDDGTNSDYATGGGACFPVFHAAPLDRTPSPKGGPYSHGEFPGTNQFGLFTVVDSGAFVPLKIIWSGRLADNQELVHYEFTPGQCHACCESTTGNIDCDPEGGVDISDLSRLIDYLFISQYPLCCSHAANLDGQPRTDIADLTRLIDRLFISFSPPPACSL
jgi:phosphodiesterase/alkaline phosphatase D-like protein